MAKRFDNLESELSAYLDGELDDARRAEVERYLAEHADARALLNELRQTVGLVQGLERQSAPTDLSEDLLGRLERRSLLGDEQEFLTPEPRSSLGKYLATAAVLFLTFGVGMLIFQQEFSTSEQPTITQTMAARDTAEQEADHFAVPEARTREFEKQKEASEPKIALDELERVGGMSRFARTKMKRADDVRADQAKNDVVGDDMIRDDTAKDDAVGDEAVQSDEMRVAMNHPAPPAAVRPEVALKVAPADRYAEPVGGQSLGPMVKGNEKAGVVAQSFVEKNSAPAQAATSSLKKSSTAKIKSLGYLANAKSPTAAQPSEPISEPRQVLRVLYEDAPAQQAGAETTWVYLANNNIEILSLTENKPLRQLAEEHEGSKELVAALANTESQYLVRGTPDQILALGVFFRTDTGALNVTMDPQDAGAASSVASSADVEEQTVDRFSQKKERAVQQADAVDRLETDRPAVTSGKKTSRPMPSLSVAPARKPISNRALQIDSAASKDGDVADDTSRFAYAISPKPPMTQPISARDQSRARVGRSDRERAATTQVGRVSVPATSLPTGPPGQYSRSAMRREISLTTRQSQGLRSATQPANEESEKKATQQRVTVLIRLQQRVAGAANQPAHITPQTTRPTDSKP